MFIKLLGIFCVLQVITARNFRLGQKFDQQKEAKFSSPLSSKITDDSQHFSEDRKLDITFGDSASPHEYPWQVALLSTDGKEKLICGGSIISDEWILTSAQCNKRSDELLVVAGAHELRSNEDTQVRILSSEFIPHEGFDSKLYKDDIALVRLSQKLEFNEFVQPAPMPKNSSANLHFAANLKVTGFGKTDIEKEAPSLQESTMVIVTKEECLQSYREKILTDQVFCGWAIVSGGPCNGDTGGPALFKTDKTEMLYGTISYKAGMIKNCYNDYHIIFTKVPRYLDWISQKTGIFFD